MSREYVFEISGKLACFSARSRPIPAKKVFILLTATFGSDSPLSYSMAELALVSVLIIPFTTFQVALMLDLALVNSV